MIAVVYSAVMTLYMLLTGSAKTASPNYLLIVRGTDYTSDLDECLSTYGKRICLKAKNITKDTFELVYDVKPQSRREESHLTEMFLAKPNVLAANLLSSNSEVE